LTEALAIPLFAVFLWFYAEDDARSWRWALAGAATGLVVLTRAVFLYVGLTAWAAVLIADRGRPLRRRFVNVAVAAAIAAAVVSPWVIRNYILAGRFILVTENAGTVLYQHNRFLEPGAPSLWGVAETPAFRAYIARYPADPVTRELAHQDYLKARALEIIRAQPAAYAAACGRRVFHFFSPTPDLADRVSENAPLFRLLPFVFVYNIALLLAGAAGVVRAPAARWRWFFLGTLVVVTLIHAATISLLRYRLPVDEAFTVAAGFGVAAVFRRRRAAGP
jgi:4-amino-4-deoxy-L-arabinose transferase-like glycosyltransferase